MTDDDVEKIIKRNMNLQINLAGVRADFEEAQQRTWVGLTDEDKLDAKIKGCSLDDYIEIVEAKLRSKNI